jgi:putative transposase
MAQYNITLSGEVLKGLFSGGQGVANMLEQGLNQVLQAQATEQLNAEPYERSAERQGHRNGTRPHPITTRVGTRVLRVPRRRNGSFPQNCLHAINAVSKPCCGHLGKW